jgi:hypothetical protein
MKLEDIASVIRSKNAGRGPSLSTSRCMAWPRATCGSSPIRSAAPSTSSCRARVTAGDPVDTDAYGAQQHGPLLGIEL